MAFSFDAAQKRISLSAGTVSLDVRAVYSRWKEWAQAADNSKYLPAFSVTGGDTIDAASGTSIPCYAFLQDGWRVKPQEAHHTLNVTGGVLLVSGGGDPFVETAGSYVVRINYQQPVQAITVSTGGTVAPTQQQIRDAMALSTAEAAAAGSLDDKINDLPQNNRIAIMGAGIEGEITLEQMLRLLAAVHAGQIVRNGSTYSIQALNAAPRERIGGTVDANGNRTITNLDVAP